MTESERRALVMSPRVLHRVPFLFLTILCLTATLCHGRHRLIRFGLFLDQEAHQFLGVFSASTVAQVMTAVNKATRVMNVHVSLAAYVKDESSRGVFNSSSLQSLMPYVHTLSRSYPQELDFLQVWTGHPAHHVQPGQRNKPQPTTAANIATTSTPADRRQSLVIAISLGLILATAFICFLVLIWWIKRRIKRHRQRKAAAAAVAGRRRRVSSMRQTLGFVPETTEMVPRTESTSFTRKQSSP